MLVEKKGERTGFATTYESWTVGVTHRFSEPLAIRPEFRYEYAFSARPWDNGLKNSQTMLAIHAIIRNESSGVCFSGAHIGGFAREDGSLRASYTREYEIPSFTHIRCFICWFQLGRLPDPESAQSAGRSEIRARRIPAHWTQILPGRPIPKRRCLLH